MPEQLRRWRESPWFRTLLIAGWITGLILAPQPWQRVCFAVLLVLSLFLLAALIYVRHLESRASRLLHDSGPVEVDEIGVRRLMPNDPDEWVRWSDLVKVEIYTTDDGPIADDVFWVLSGADGSGVVVPSEQASDDFLDRVQALPGFDNEAVISAMMSTDHAVFHCWSAGAG